MARLTFDLERPARAAASALAVAPRALAARPPASRRSLAA